MGRLYEIATTIPAFAKAAYYDAHPPARSKGPATIPFGPDPQQRCVLWEPDAVAHEMPVLYFHGGAYVFGSPESMADAANVYNAMGYRGSCNTSVDLINLFVRRLAILGNDN